MKVLIIGGGGREHALAWRLAESPRVSELFAMPGNPGIAQVADVVSGEAMDFKAITKFATQNKIEFVVIGPEDPLAAGLADHLIAQGIKVFGPTKDAAQIEADKWFAKELMRQQAVPTAEARSFTDPSAAEEYVRKHGAGVVIKAAGLAKGKGVTIAYRTPDAIEAIDQIMRKKAFGGAGGRIVIEEMLRGPEVSVRAFVDNKNI
jgi:phosphoribosylamine---glycine ligase